MGIYNTLTYNPLGSIQTAINNVNERNRIKRDYWKNKGEIWSKAVKDLGSIAGKAIDYYQAYKESPEGRLEALQKELEEAERIKEIQDKYNQQVAQRKAFDEYANSPSIKAANEMRDYVPNEAYSQYLGAINNYNLPLMQEYYRRGR